MVERGEIITVCRQIGGMMEAGVDILRVTRVLRAQTRNPRLLQVYDDLDHDLTMGHSLAEAMGHAPDVWSPFAVSLVQQGEARNDIAGTFVKIAEYLQKEEQLRESAYVRERPSGPPPERVTELLPLVNSGSPMTVIALDGLIDRLQTIGLRLLTIVSGLLLTLAAVWFLVDSGMLEHRWINVTLFSVAALFIGGTGVWVQRRLMADRRREARCSFCGQYSANGMGLERAPRFAGAAICGRCASIVARRHGGPETTHIQEGEVTSGPPAPKPVATDAGGVSKAAGVNLNGNAVAQNNVAEHHEEIYE